MVYTAGARESSDQSDQHRNCFQGDLGKTPERQGGAHMGISECNDPILNQIKSINPKNSDKLEQAGEYSCTC